MHIFTTATLFLVICHVFCFFLTIAFFKHILQYDFIFYFKLSCNGLFIFYLCIAFKYYLLHTIASYLTMFILFITIVAHNMALHIYFLQLKLNISQCGFVLFLTLSQSPSLFIRICQTMKSCFASE